MSGYIGSRASVVSSGAERKKTFDITGTTTSLTGLSYTVNQVHVFHNGVRLVDGTDFTATNGSSITLTSAAESGDEVVVISYAGYQVSDTVSASQGGTFAGDVTFDGTFTSQGIDDNATSTAMTLDSSGNLLVGKTATGYNTNAGTELWSNGFSAFTRDDAIVSYYNRKTSDGDIVQFLKDGSTVASIGVDSGDNITFGATSGGGSGLFMFGAGGTSPFILPMKEGALSDNTVTLGDNARRFKDLYLSGGVYLGGVGSANFLSDYETGTFTPAFQSITNPTYVAQTGYYIKIGSFVSYHYRIEWSAGTSIGAIVNGLPFTARNGQDEYPMTSNVYHDQSLTYSGSRTTAIGYVFKNTTNMDLVCIGSAQTVDSLTFSTSGSIYVTGQYYTNA